MVSGTELGSLVGENAADMGEIGMESRGRLGERVSSKRGPCPEGSIYGYMRHTTQGRLLWRPALRPAAASP